MIASDIAVLGGGSMGLFLAEKLSRQGYSVSIIDGPRLAGFSSTKNQGWLHSGAWYAANDQPEVARHCAKGLAEYQDALENQAEARALPDIGCFYLLRSQHELDALQKKCHLASRQLDPDFVIACKPASIPAKLQALLTASGRGEIKCVARVGDRPANTNRILGSFARTCAAAGVSFLHAPNSLLDAAIEREADGWRIQLPRGEVVAASALVLASGALIPDVAALVPGAELQDSFRILEILVTVLHEPIVDQLTVIPMPGRDEPPNLSPFFHEDGAIVGTSVCLVGSDYPIASSQETRVETELLEHHEVADSLSIYLPGLVGSIDKQGPIPAHFYRCQKLELVDSGEAREGMVIDLTMGSASKPPPIIAVYPGKMTTAPVVADKVIQRLEKVITPSGPQSSNPSPEVAERPYFRPATHELFTPEPGRLAFRTIL